MNVIQCLVCMDMLAPLEAAGVRVCHCGQVQMRAVPVEEVGHNNLVEVKIFNLYIMKKLEGKKRRDRMRKSKKIKQITTKNEYDKYAQTVKVHNDYLQGVCDLYEMSEYDRDNNTLFYQNMSYIVIADLDTPGVKVVKEWSNPELKTSKQWIEHTGCP